MPRKSEFSKWQQAQGLSDEGMAALLSEKTGREVTVETLAEVRNKGGLRRYHKVLGIDAESQQFRAGDDGAAPEPGESNPREKPFRPEPVDELDWRSAEEAITAAYVAIGQGVSMIRKRPEIAEVFKAGAPILARDWVALGKVDPRVRSVITKVTVAGPMGALAMDHLVLIGKLLTLERNVISAANIPGADEIAGIYVPPSANGSGDGAGTHGPVGAPGTSPPR